MVSGERFGIDVQQLKTFKQAILSYIDDNAEKGVPTGKTWSTSAQNASTFLNNLSKLSTVMIQSVLKDVRMYEQHVEAFALFGSDGIASMQTRHTKSPGQAVKQKRFERAPGIKETAY